jgi:hypothetical protein
MVPAPYAHVSTSADRGLGLGATIDDVLLPVMYGLCHPGLG